MNYKYRHIITSPESIHTWTQGSFQSVQIQLLALCPRLKTLLGRIKDSNCCTIGETMWKSSVHIAHAFNCSIAKVNYQSKLVVPSFQSLDMTGSHGSLQLPLF
ncbi:hypothetical protein CIPAW_02G065900 [Carya illinoinensis]|uniref:Uncharacterized protein n=1 Tax=Carya illinoinensis TaxID=32201 RepID=A0A8T1RBS6_CARIL|nr:hypothetical protein CIPAW_02G065900 [Carya illinoinensis]